ncbi:hypothetical protein CMK20_17105 [Candidatus Poribacteria bacterium]|nr:hypothetical protein [Candidatus Poribacteria bacterium]
MEMLSGGSTQGGGTAVGGASYPTAMSIFFHVVALLFVLVVLQKLLPQSWKPYFLSTTELSIIYAIMTIGTAVAGVDMLQVLVPITAYPTWFATPENEWDKLFLSYLPDWWVIHDRSILNGFYKGEDQFGAYLIHWLPVIGAWTSFLMAIIFVTAGLSAILRRQWVEHERLTYPITQLPLSLLDSKNQILRIYPFWVGFITTAIITLYNGLAYLFPHLPILIWSLDLRSVVTDSPWKAIGPTPVRIFPFVVSMAFLIPHELSFSCWFFYWLMKGLKVMGFAFGWRTLPQFPYSRHQSFGAYMGIFAFVLFAGRHYFINALLEAYRSTNTDGEGSISMRYAFIYVFVGGLFLIGFSVYAGMSVWIALAFFSLYFTLSIGLSRIRAELGAPVHDLHFMGPQRLVVFATGTHLVDNQNLTLLSIFSWFNRAYRCHPMPVQLESLKLAQVQKFSGRHIFFALIIGSAIGAITVWWKLLDAFYLEGGSRGIASYAVSAFGREPYTLLEGWLTYPDPPDIPALIAVALGFCLTLMMLIVRSRLIWWQIHPLGYTLADDYAMNWIWSSVLCGWALKLLMLKLGGIRVYRTALPFFIGLILGEFVSGSFWSILSLITGQPMYAFKNW